jgi:hypothetical protein
MITRNPTAPRAWLLRLASAAVALVALLATSTTAAAAPVRHEPPPAWRTVVDAGEVAAGAAPSDAASSGSRYILFDQQTRVGTGSVDVFTHVVREVSNEAGLQSLSQLSIETDATYQTLIFHSLVIHRGKETLDRLALESLKLVQREPMLEAQVYDGRQSAILFLADLRVGDVVEYAYTHRGADPSLGGRFAGGVLLGMPFPVDRIHARILIPRGRSLRTAPQGPPLDPPAPPHVEERDGFTELTWDRRDTPAYIVENDAPAWYDPLPWSQVSEFASWADVAALGTTLFRGSVTSPAGGPRPLAQWVEKTRREFPSPRAYELAAVRFVKDVVRYVGIEVGLARWRPTDPRVVFERRYGDCKDKASLLATLLTMGGLRARPALVSSTHGHVLERWLPSPLAFDHAIVRVDAPDGVTHWVDATTTLQGGPVDRFVSSPYERALTLDAAATALEVLAPSTETRPSLLVRDHLVLGTPGEDGESSLESERTYEGNVADMMRAALRSKNRDESTKYFLSLYQDDYPSVHEVRPLEQADDRVANVLRVTAHFSIPAIWTWDAKESRHAAMVVARSVERLLPRAVRTNHEAPIALPFPYHARVELDVDLPFDLPLTPDTLAVRTPSFDFGFNSSAPGARHVAYAFELQTKSSAVTDAELTTHAAGLEKARNALRRSLTFRPAQPDGINWAAVMAVSGCVPFLVWGAIVAYRFRPASRPVPRDPHAPEGLAGWLVLLALGLLSSIVANSLAVVREARIVFSLATWHALTLPQLPTYQPGLAMLAVVELVVMLAISAYGVVVTLLFFGKRRSFPLQFKVYAICGVVFIVVDNLATAAVTPSAHALPLMAIARSAFGAGVWCAYVARSKRVAATFVRSPGRARPRRRPPVASEEHRVAMNAEEAAIDPAPVSDAEATP